MKNWAPRTVIDIFANMKKDKQKKNGKTSNSKSEKEPQEPEAVRHMTEEEVEKPEAQLVSI